MKRSTTTGILIISVIMAFNEQVTAQCIDCSGGTATGNAASIIGLYNTASGEASFAGGYGCTAAGGLSFSFGGHSFSNGTSAATLGHFLHAEGTHTMAIGSGASLENKLTNTISKSLMIGFGSEKPTLFIGGTGPGLTGKIGIGNVTEPQAKLHIKADNYEAAELYLEPDQFGVSNGATLWLGTKEYGIRARWGKLEFKVGNDGRYLFNDGYVGIGTTNPVAELQVNGNIFIEKDNAGLVLKSPDGQCWKITVSNAGELATTSINCTLTTDIDTKTPVENNIRIFPNPTSGELTIEAEQELNQGRVSIFSMEGRQLYSEQIQGITAKIDLRHLQPGIYIVNVEGDGRIIKSQQVVLK
jgi:hypothetical protein